jgi:hypothetical protein
MQEVVAEAVVLLLLVELEEAELVLLQEQVPVGRQILAEAVAEAVDQVLLEVVVVLES